MRDRRLIRYGERFTQAEVDDGAVDLEQVPPVWPGLPAELQDEHWPADWGEVTARGDAR